MGAEHFVGLAANNYPRDPPVAEFADPTVRLRSPTLYVEYLPIGFVVEPVQLQLRLAPYSR